MPETAQPRSALAGTAPYTGADDVLALAERTGSTLLHLEGACAGSELDAVLAALGLSALPAPGRSGGHDGVWLLGLGPTIWLLLLERLAVAPSALTLSGAAGRAFVAALDTSHAYTRIEMTGQKTAALIAKGCALDLHPRHFPPGACAAAGLAGLRTILWRPHDGDRFDLFVGRSHAVSLWEWLLDAGAEYRADGGASSRGAQDGT